MERQPILNETQRLGQMAEAYLGVAERTMQSSLMLGAEMDSLHLDYFVTSRVSQKDLIAASIYGNHLVESFAIAQRTPDDEMRTTPIPVPELPEELGHLIDEYHGIDEARPQMVSVERLEALAAEADVATDVAALDLILEELNADTKLLPSMRDVAAMIGLGTIRMRRHLSHPEVQERLHESSLPANIRLPRDGDPAKQAISLALTYFAGGGDMHRFVQGLERIGVATNRSEAIALIREWLSARQLTDALSSSSSMATAHGHVTLRALHQTEEVVRGLRQIAFSSDQSLDADQAWQVAEYAESISRRAAAVLRQMMPLIGRALLANESLALPRFDRETALRDQLRLKVLSEQAGRMAALQVARQEARVRASRDLEAWRNDYLMTRSKLRREHPDSRQLIGQLAGGEVGDRISKAERVTKDDAYDVAGLVYKLDGMLAQRDGVDVFDELIEAIDIEAALSDEAGEIGHIARAHQWLVDNLAFALISDVEVLNRVGKALDEYRLPKLRSNAPTEQKTRMLSTGTTQALEAIRETMLLDAEQLNIRGFPPGPMDLDMVRQDAQELSERLGRDMATLDEDRFVILAELNSFFSSQGAKVQLFRLLPGDLRARFPYYALVIERGGVKVVVAENPEKDNATYVFTEFDKAFASWEEMVQLPKGTMKDELGGRQMVHNARSGPDAHYRRICDEVLHRLAAS